MYHLLHDISVLMHEWLNSSLILTKSVTINVGLQAIDTYRAYLNAYPTWRILMKFDKKIFTKIE
jgi:hypothetical protein